MSSSSSSLRHHHPTELIGSRDQRIQAALEASKAYRPNTTTAQLVKLTHSNKLITTHHSSFFFTFLSYIVVQYSPCLKEQQHV